MKKNILFTFLACLLILGACNTSPSNDEISMASTAAVQTVEARFTQDAENAIQPESIKTEKSAEIATASVISTIPAIATTVDVATPDVCVVPEGALVANLVYENMPDGTVLETGEYFTKSWTLQNNGTYTWHKGYKLIFWDGNRLGGSFEYPFFDDVAPGETMAMPIQLLAPDSAGTYSGSWKIKTPSGCIFGVGQYNAPIYVSIDVREKDDIEYGITSVEYYMTRDPKEGCPANVWRTIYAVVSVSGPIEIRYQFYQRESDGGIVKQPKKWLRFTEAGTKTIETVWPLNRCTTQNPRYVNLIILDPGDDSFLFQHPSEFMFINDCPDQCP